MQVTTQILVTLAFGLAGAGRALLVPAFKAPGGEAARQAGIEPE